MLKGTAVNLALSSSNEWLLEITPAVPLKLANT